MFVIQIKHNDSWYYIHSIFADGIGVTSDRNYAIRCHSYAEAALFAGVIGAKFPHFADPDYALCVTFSAEAPSCDDFDAGIVIF